MKTKQFIPLIAAAILVLTTAQQARATADTNKFACSLTFYKQGATTEKYNPANDSTTFTSKVETKRGTDKDLLVILAETTAMTFPSGSFLEIDGDIFDGGVTVVVKSRTNSVIVDVSQYFDISVTSDDIYSGKWNDTTLAENSTDYYTVHIKFDNLNGKSFDVTGFAQESYGSTALNKDGIHTLSDSISIVVAGTATLDGENANVKGTVTLKGKSLSDN